MPSLRMMTRVMGLEIKLVIAVVALVFIAKSCGHQGVDQEAIKALGPEPERVFQVDCAGGYIKVAASAELARQKGEISADDQVSVTGYSSEYERRISHELVNPDMHESDAISAVANRCYADFERYNSYQKKLEALKMRS